MVKNLKNKIFILTGICIGILLFMYFGPPDTVLSLVHEDGLIEYSSALFYLITSVFCFYQLFKKPKRHKLFIGLWAVLCIIFMGEEVSWFQRVLNYDVPMIESVNKQSEFNLHNLYSLWAGDSKQLVEEMISEGKYENLFKLIFHSHNLFRIGFYGYFLILPLLYFWAPVRKILNKLEYPKPDLILSISYMLILILSFYLQWLAPASGISQKALIETREMFYAFFILFYVLTYLNGKYISGNGLEMGTSSG